MDDSGEVAQRGFGAISSDFEQARHRHEQAQAAVRMLDLKLDRLKQCGADTAAIVKASNRLADARAEARHAKRMLDKSTRNLPLVSVDRSALDFTGPASPLVLASRLALTHAQAELEALDAERRSANMAFRTEDEAAALRQERAIRRERIHAAREVVKDAQIDLFMAPVRDAEDAFFARAIDMAEALYKACLAARSVRKRLGVKATHDLSFGLHGPLPETLPSFTDHATDSEHFQKWSELMAKRRRVTDTDGADNDLRA